MRCEVLWYLRQGELVAQIAEPARDFGAPPALTRSTTAHRTSDSPDDAARLAVALRALSLAWATLLAWMLRIARRRADGLRIDGAIAVRAAAPARIAALPPDTS